VHFCRSRHSPCFSSRNPLLSISYEYPSQVYFYESISCEFSSRGFIFLIFELFDTFDKFSPTISNFYAEKYVFLTNMLKFYYPIKKIKKISKFYSGQKINPINSIVISILRDRIADAFFQQRRSRSQIALNYLVLISVYPQFKVKQKIHVWWEDALFIKENLHWPQATKRKAFWSFYLPVFRVHKVGIYNKSDSDIFISHRYYLDSMKSIVWFFKNLSHITF